MKKLILIVAAACCLVSCKKFLSERAQSDIVPETTEHYGEILFSDGYPERLGPLQSWAVYLDDDVEAYYSSAIGIPGVADIAAPIFQWQPNYPELALTLSSNYNFNAWIVYYRTILGANVVIEYIDGAKGNEADRRRIKGEAYALRAFYHFMLVNLYAAPYNDSTTTPDKMPGIPIRTTADLSETFPARNTVKEVYELIEHDLDSAISLLSDYKGIRDKTRMNYLAANLLASRVYLYEEKWDKAIAHADEVLAYQAGLMDLNAWGTVPDPVNKPVLGINNVETVWTYGSEKEKAPALFAQTFDLSHNLVNTFEASDLRKQIGMFVNPPELKPYIAPDFSQQKYATNLAVPYQNAPSWRIAEVYLNRAEAYIQKYKTTGEANAANEALSSLNTLRSFRIASAAFQNWTLVPAAQLLEMCREERRRELFLEEMHRWFDLRRYGMPAIEHIYRPDASTTKIFRLEARDKMYVLPLTDQVMSRNPALTQNPQYNGTRMPR
ncbi:RagB/SusD family nutrient uptake outer membrane protein [Chitinophaga deserti]|uniref:RagB/SusD family nutrient uptake outer membrane protein n=1 Tax=Chitinophaga deserti TaxID=2164099 RepID=UPI000D6D1FA4|nr:RagB/SusD family nutrient uptake outer membrane protein [Chitinophaga deserti]